MRRFPMPKNPTLQAPGHAGVVTLTSLTCSHTPAPSEAEGDIPIRWPLGGDETAKRTAIKAQERPDCHPARHSGIAI